jgi:hypothetical protein
MEHHAALPGGRHGLTRAGFKGGWLDSVEDVV